MERKEFLRTIQEYRRRINLAELCKVLVFALAVGAAVGIIFQVIALLLPFYYANLYTALAMVLAVVTALAAAYIKRVNMKQAALIMDRFGFQERIVTAYEHLKEEGEMVLLQRKDAMEQLKAHKDRIQIVMLPSKKRLVWMVGLLVLMCGMMLLPSDSKEYARQLHEVRQEAKEKEEEIEEVVEGLEKLAKEELSPEQIAALQEMMEGMQSSMTEYKQATSQEMLAAAQEKLEYKYGDMGSQLAELAAALQNGATASVATAQSMQAMANQLQQMSGMSNLASNQGQNGQSGNGQGGQSGTGQSGQNGGQSGQSGNNQNGQSGNNQNGNQSGNNQNGQSGTGQGSGSGQSTGNGQGSGQGSGNGSGTGNGSGSGSGSGRGEGSSSAIHDYVSIPNAIISSGNLTGNAQNHNNSDFFRAQNGLSWEGERVSHEAVIGQYEQNAYEGIAAGQYPSGMEDVIKEYFASFN